MFFDAGNYDICVIGAGHAGIEASVSAAKLGCRVALFTLSLDAIGNLPCNPSIGGTAKGHLVREIDALGGVMATAADATMIQSRMLNRGKGPAVHSLRNQTDRSAYRDYMKRLTENTKGLELMQAEVVSVEMENNCVKSVTTKLGARYGTKAVIICTGTYQNGVIHVGENSFESGPDSSQPSKGLSDSLKGYGINLRRFKTGTPARVHADSINYEKLEVQEGDVPIIPFSFYTNYPLENKKPCYLTYTNLDTHRVILENLHRSPLYRTEDKIRGIGPRYCPSIEDKVMRFKDKDRHQIFIEPVGDGTKEMYLQGMSSSLPYEVQLAFYHTIVGLENVQIMRPAYAIEYDCVDPTLLLPTLEFKDFCGLYGAGQFNGSSGYEEAAAQGLIAGINAVRKINGQGEFILTRANSYIGTLIDDLVTKGCEDPYRMMTSRSEYRLFLRQDNADSRLTQMGYEIGLVPKEKYSQFLQKEANIKEEIARVKATTIKLTPELNDLLLQKGTTPLETAVKMDTLVKRPQLSYKDLQEFDPNRPMLTAMEAERVEIEIKYEGYLSKQSDQIEQAMRMEKVSIPEGFDFTTVRGLRLEAVEKLGKHRPQNLGQASRISGVSPADIAVLIIYLEQQRRKS